MRPAAATGCRLVLALALLGPAPILAQAPPRDERNASYWNRVDHPPPDALQPPRSWYQPTTAVAGAPGPFLPIAAAGQGTLPAQALDEASQFAQANHSQALIIIHKGVVQLERYYGGTSATSEFSSHSFAKTLAALALGAAQADGKIASLDQPASTWLPEWRDEKRKAITLRQLLTMSGGFRTAPDADPAGHYMQLHYGADVEAIAAAAPVNYPPGQGWAYDNDNLHGIGLVVERATGMPYADYVSKRLWQALGAGPAEMLLDREGGRGYAYCCIWAVPRDWARLGQMLLDGGVWQGQRLLPQAFVDELRKPSAANPNFGFQVLVGAAWTDARINRAFASQKATLPASEAPDLYYLSGAGGLQMAIMPSDQLVVLRVGKGAPGWRDHALPNLLHAALHPQQTSDVRWIYDWRVSTRSPMGQPSLFDPTKTNYWPTERVAGRPRRCRVVPAPV